MEYDKHETSQEVGSDACAQDLNKIESSLSQIGRPHFAIATTDTAFKHMLSMSLGSESSIVISLLNCFVPAFRGDPVAEVTEAPVSIPALKLPGEKQTFMDLHVISSRGIHYIIEMQAQRHVMFDKRVLFYACGTYSRQLSEDELGKPNWYVRLKAVIALQILDYDTNRVRGIKAEVPDNLVDQVKNHPQKEHQFVKHFILHDLESGQKIDHLQLVQVELPRAAKTKKLIPNEKFSLADWWVRVLSCAHEFTRQQVENLRHSGEMPEDIYKALRRLNLQEWNPQEIREYQQDFFPRELFATTLAVEREEGIEEGIKLTARSLKAIGIPIETISKCTGLSAAEIENLGEVVHGRETIDR